MPLLASSALEAHGWGLIITPIGNPGGARAAFLYAHGLNNVPLKPGPKAGEHLLELVPYRDPADPDSPAWTFFDGANHRHDPADIWRVLVDTGANTSIIGDADASKLARLDRGSYPSVYPFSGAPVRILGRGLLRIVALPAANAEGFALFSSKFQEALALAPVVESATGGGPHTIRRIFSSEEATCRSAPDDLTSVDEGLRAAVFAQIPDAIALSERLNIRHRPTLAAIGSSVGGIRKFDRIPVALPIDLLHAKALLRRPDVRKMRNALSTALREHLRPGDVFWTDLNQRQLPDFEGYQFSRTGMDDRSGRVLLSWSRRADTESLLEHLEDLCRSALRYRGHGPSVFRMDFAAEAMVQGRGDRAHTHKLTLWLDAHPGIRVIATAPHTPEHNRVEPTQGRLHALALLNHMRARVGRLGWRAMEMGAAFQLNQHRASGKDVSRDFEFTNVPLDASRILAPCGQGGFTHRDDAKASALRKAAEPCLYIRPSEFTTGQIVLKLFSLKFFVVRSMVPLEGNALCLAALATSALHGDGHTPLDLSASDHSLHIRALFAAFDGDVGLSAVRYNALTGVPESAILLAPVLNDEGELCLVAEDRALFLAGPVVGVGSEQVDAPALGAFERTPLPGSAAGDGLEAEGHIYVSACGTVADGTRKPFHTSDMLALDPASRIQFAPDGKAPKGSAAPSASRRRYMVYRGARSISEFFLLHPSVKVGDARADLLNDMRVGLALIRREDLAPRPARVSIVRGPPREAVIARFRAQVASRPPLDPGQRLLLDAISDADASLEQFFGMETVEGLRSPLGTPSLETAAVDLEAEAYHSLFPNLGADERYISASGIADHAFGDTLHRIPDYRGEALRALAAADTGNEGLDLMRSSVRLITSDRVRPPSAAPTGVNQALSFPDFAGPGGWGESIVKQIRQVETFRAWILVSHATYLAVLARVGSDRITRGNLLMIFRYKTDGDGFSLPGGGLKSRCAIAPQTVVPSSVLTYSATADDLTDRMTASMAQDDASEATTADVICAYFQGRPPSEAEGGQQVFVRTPSWLHRFGNYPERDAHGRPTWLHVIGNFPGLATAGPCWQQRYDAFLLERGFRQSAIDRRLFFFESSDGRLMLLIHVDDTRIYFSSHVILVWFMRPWCLEFGSPPPSPVLDTNFCGVNRRQWNTNTTIFTAGAVMHALETALKPYPLINGEQCNVPMLASAPRELRRGGGPDDTFALDKVAAARSIIGMAGFIVARVRPDGNFAFCVLSKYMGARLTMRAWRYLLRFAWYLVFTAELPLVLFSDPVSRPKDGSRTPFVIEMFSDSSHGDTEDGGSHGGFVIVRMTGSPPRPTATLAWKTMVVDGVDSTGAQELAMLVKAYRWILGMRSLVRDANTGHDPDPCKFHTDAAVVIDQNDLDKLNKDSRWIACRLAMLRHGQLVGAIELLKVPSEDNIADMFTKPLQGDRFVRLRSILLGLDHLNEHNVEAPIKSGPTWTT